MAIVRTKDVCGGNLRIDGTRICLYHLIHYFYLEDGVDKVIESYPHLTKEQVIEAFEYIREHRYEIEAERLLDEEA